MSRLGTRVQNSLDETRMLILGAQVLIGFAFQATLQPGFDRLPVDLQLLKLVGLSLMLVAAGLLMAPGAFHQIVEGGNDSGAVVGYATRIAALALLPFMLGMSIDVYIAAFTVVGAQGAAVTATLVGVLAVFLWYGLGLVLRGRDQVGPGQELMTEKTPLETKIKQVLTEARVVLPGAQALLGFQFAAFLQDSFTRLPKSSQVLHLGALGLIAASIVFLMAPAAFHRLVEQGEDTERVHRFASVMLICAMVPLALGIAVDFYVVLVKVLDAPEIALALAGASLVFFYGLWFGLTLAVRAISRRPHQRVAFRSAR